jgi:hypothetical protein
MSSLMRAALPRCPTSVGYPTGCEERAAEMSD